MLALFHALSLSVSLALRSIGATAMAMAAGGAPMAAVRLPSHIRLMRLPLHCPHSLLPSRWPKEISKSKMFLFSCHLFDSGAAVVISLLLPMLCSGGAVLLTSVWSRPAPAWALLSTGRPPPRIPGWPKPLADRPNQPRRPPLLCFSDQDLAQQFD